MAASTANSNNPSTFASLVAGLPINQNATATNNPTLLSMGGTGGVLGSLYGQTPGVANPVASAKTATSGNIGNLPGIANLTQGTDAISNAGAASGLQQNLPGYESMLNQASTNTQQELSGQLPQDVVNQITQEAAERGVATGQGTNSQDTNSAMLSAMGQNSEQQMQTGQSNLNTLIGETPQGAQFNPASMFVTPTDEQAAQQGVQNAMAAPDPGASGLFSSIMSFL